MHAPTSADMMFHSELYLAEDGQRSNSAFGLFPTCTSPPPPLTHLCRCDVGQRVVLDEGAGAAVNALKGGVNLHDGHGHARARALVLALARDPCLERLELAAQRQNLGEGVRGGRGRRRQGEKLQVV